MEPSAPQDAPPLVAELAASCVRFVERAVGVALDYTSDTLPLLDHYVLAASSEAKHRPEALSLVARASAAYLGEVIRRRYICWWHQDGDDVAAWHLRFEQVYLMLSPYALVCAAMGIGDEAASIDAGIIVEEEALETIAAHLALQPEVTEEEFRRLSTRYDVLEIVVDQLKAKALGDNLGDVAFDDSDYDD